MKNKRLILGLMGLVGFMGGLAAQNGFNLPYSQFGIGSKENPFCTPMATRMGGVAYTRSGSNWINPYNPASYGGIGMESFVFDMAANIKVTRLQNNTDHLNDADGNISYLMFGMPLTRWWKLAGGLMPYGEVDYESVATSGYLENNVVKTIYDGSGSTSLAFLGSAFNLLGNGTEGRRLQAGFNVNYLSGRIQRAISYAFGGNDTTFYINKRRFKETKIGNVTFDLGLQYWEPLGKKYILGVGLTYKPYRSMDVKDKALIYTYYVSGQSAVILDTVFPAAGESETFTSTLEQDNTFGIGLSLERTGRWVAAADVTVSGWGGMKYTEGMEQSIFGESMLSTGPYSRYAVGFEKIGVMDATTYWGRISWSLGAHRETGVLRLMVDGREQSVDEWGVGLGATLPMRKGRSLLTLSVGYSSFGSKDLLQHNSLTFGIAVSSCERWFVKRKYN